MISPQFSNSFRSLPSWLYEDVTPTPLQNPRLVHVTELKNKLGLGGLSNEELMRWLNGELRLEGEQRLSSRYAGHQFGVWAGQLGDGRAISLGEVLTAEGRLEIQTKGSGLTPFSRMGDGKAVIRSSVREYLCSEAVHGLGIPTTRVLALMTGEDDVYRETVERSALIARVFPSNIRFGHFEMCFHFQREQELKELIDYTRDTFFPGLGLEGMLEEVVRRTADLMARWMSVGFCHGVMNTDNMSILGLTIDYGPYGFLDDTILDYICNHSDHSGRYAYNQQPSVAMWNLERLLVCFINIVPKERLEQILSLYPARFEQTYLGIIRKKLGLSVEHGTDASLFTQLLQVMARLNLDFTFTFRQLSGELAEFWDYYGQREEFKRWLKLYQERLTLETQSKEERLEAMRRVNPKYVLKNYIAQEVIEDVEKGSQEKLSSWLQVLYSPFDEHDSFHEYSRPTPSDRKSYVVSCSS